MIADRSIAACRIGAAPPIEASPDDDLLDLDIDQMVNEHYKSKGQAPNAPFGSGVQDRHDRNHSGPPPSGSANAERILERHPLNLEQNLERSGRSKSLGVPSPSGLERALQVLERALQNLERSLQTLEEMDPRALVCAPAPACLEVSATA